MTEIGNHPGGLLREKKVAGAIRRIWHRDSIRKNSGGPMGPLALGIGGAYSFFFFVS